MSDGTSTAPAVTTASLATTTTTTTTAMSAPASQPETQELLDYIAKLQLTIAELRIENDALKSENVKYAEKLGNLEALLMDQPGAGTQAGSKRRRFRRMFQKGNRRNTATSTSTGAPSASPPSPASGNDANANANANDDAAAYSSILGIFPKSWFGGNAKSSNRSNNASTSAGRSDTTSSTAELTIKPTAASAGLKSLPEAGDRLQPDNGDEDSNENSEDDDSDGDDDDNEDDDNSDEQESGNKGASETPSPDRHGGVRTDNSNDDEDDDDNDEEDDDDDNNNNFVDEDEEDEEDEENEEDEDEDEEGKQAASQQPEPASSEGSNDILSGVTSLLRRMSALVDRVSFEDKQAPPKVHQLIPIHFKKPTWCDVCNAYIWGLGKQSLTCTECGMRMHSKCRDRAGICQGPQLASSPGGAPGGPGRSGQVAHSGSSTPSIASRSASPTTLSSSRAEPTSPTRKTPRMRWDMPTAIANFTSRQQRRRRASSLKKTAPGARNRSSVSPSSSSASVSASTSPNKPISRISSSQNLRRSIIANAAVHVPLTAQRSHPSLLSSSSPLQQQPEAEKNQEIATPSEGLSTAIASTKSFILQPSDEDNVAAHPPTISITRGSEALPSQDTALSAPGDGSPLPQLSSSTSSFSLYSSVSTGSGASSVSTSSSFGRIDEESFLVRLLVIEALHLPRKDFFGSIDPYCIISFADNTYKTRVIRNNRNPVWNQRLLLLVRRTQVRYHLVFTVYDHDYSTSNDYVGYCVVTNLGELCDVKSHDLFLPLLDAKKDDVQVGTLHIKLEFMKKQQLETYFWQRLGKWRSISFFDHSSSNCLQIDEFTMLLDALGCDLDESQVNRIFERADKDRTGRITAAQLASAIANESTGHQLIQIERCPVCKHSLPKDDHQAVLHMASCLESDPDSVDDFVIGGFLTSSYACKGWVKKLFGNITRGRYSLTANNGNILIMNRSTGLLEEEEIPSHIRLSLRILYQSKLSPPGLNGNRLQTNLLKVLRHLTTKQGRKFNDPSSVKHIPPFIRYHRLDMSEFIVPPEGYRNFNEFFYRKIKPEMRPIAAPLDPSTAVSPADCRSNVFSTIHSAIELWIKGDRFNIATLLDDEQLARKFSGGALAIFRLAPQDYHRFHIPVNGFITRMYNIEGEYCTVNPMAVRQPDVNVFTDNKRHVSVIESNEFGTVAYVSIGATLVGSIVITTEVGQYVKKGDEHGYFAFGGSTLVLLFEPGRIIFDEDLIANSMRPVETLIRMGSSIGHGTYMAPTRYSLSHPPHIDPAEDVHMSPDKVAKEANLPNIGAIAKVIAGTAAAPLGATLGSSSSTATHVSISPVQVYSKSASTMFKSPSSPLEEPRKPQSPSSAPSSATPHMPKLPNLFSHVHIPFGHHGPNAASTASLPPSSPPPASSLLSTATPGKGRPDSRQAQLDEEPLSVYASPSSSPPKSTDAFLSGGEADASHV